MASYIDRKFGENPCLVVAHGDRLMNVVPNGANLAIPLQFLLGSIHLRFFLALFQIHLLADQLAGIFLVLFNPGP